MAHGNIYPPEKIDAALTNYFRVGQPDRAARARAALAGRQGRRGAAAVPRPSTRSQGTWEARERVVVALTGGPEGETLIRRAARIAARSAGGDLLAVHVTKSDGLTGADPGRAGQPAAAGRVARRHLPPGRRRRHLRRAARPSPGRRTPPSSCSAPAAGPGWPRMLTGPGIGARTIRDSGDIDVHIVTHSQMGRGRGLPTAPRRHHAGAGRSPGTSSPRRCCRC